MHSFARHVQGSSGEQTLFKGVTRPSTFWKRPLPSSCRRSADSSDREHTKPGWQLSPANSSSCAQRMVVS